MKKMTKVEILDLLLDPLTQDEGFQKQMIKENELNLMKDKLKLAGDPSNIRNKKLEPITDDQYNAFLTSVDKYYDKYINKFKDLEKIMQTVNKRSHSRKVAALCKQLAIANGCDDNMKKVLYMAGYIHDMGKLINDDEHDRVGAEMAYKIAKKLKIDDIYCISLYSIIRVHSNKSKLYIKDYNEYQMILMQSDLLSKIDIAEMILMYDKTKDIEWNRNFLYERYFKKVVQRDFVFNTGFAKFLYNEKLAEYRKIIESMRY